MSERRRESLASRLGFIFLSAGCAIGLGNVWRFPYITGLYGGGAFVLVYLVCLVMLALPIVVMEFAVGRASQQSIVTSFPKLSSRKFWSWYGYIPFVGNYLLMMFYTSVAGWVLAYTWFSANGRLQGLDPSGVGQFFGSFLQDPLVLVGWLAGAVFVGAVICAMGLRSGVERVTKIMMSGLFLIMILLAFRAMTLPGAEKGLAFYLKPDLGRMLEKGIWKTIHAAMGQAFFTMGLGIGSMAVFGSYFDRSRSLTGESLIIMFLDTCVAIVAGLIIFPSCFAYGVDAGAGPGLVFVTLPNMFNNMPQGQLWSTLFFLFMSFAALSTVVAVFEHIISNYMDIFNWNRRKASLVTGLSVFALSIPTALGFNLWSHIQPLGEGSMILDLEDFVVSNNIVPIGALIYLIFCCTKWGWGWENFIAEVDSGEGMKFPKRIRPYLVFVVPILLGVIFIMGYYEKFFALRP